MIVPPEDSHSTVAKSSLCNVHHSFQGDYLLDVPAWLLLNGMRMEGLQFIQLSLQELHNVWRKRALHSLTDEVKLNSKVYSETNEGEAFQRLRRFEGEVGTYQSKCIEVFREPIGFPVEAKVPRPRPFVETLKVLVDQHNQVRVVALFVWRCPKGKNFDNKPSPAIGTFVGNFCGSDNSDV